MPRRCLPIEGYTIIPSPRRAGPHTPLSPAGQRAWADGHYNELLRQGRTPEAAEATLKAKYECERARLASQVAAD